MSDPIIRIYNEELDAHANVSQKAFDTSYSHRGWVQVPSAREEARLARLGLIENAEVEEAPEEDVEDDDFEVDDEEASPVEADESTTVEVVDDEDAS
jgi:hypothetical protein